MSCGCDCGSIMSRPAAAPVSPLEIVAADDIIAGWDAAIRVDVAGAVSVLPDVSGNGFNLTQAVAANQPTAVVGGGPNGNDSILFDGIDDYLDNAALDLPAPGTTPLTYWGVLRQITTTDQDVLWGSNFFLSIIQTAIDIFQWNGNAANGNSNWGLNIYSILEALFSNSTSDHLIVGGVTVTGQDAGNTDPGAGFLLGGRVDLVNFSNIEFCELWLFRTALTIQQRSQLRAYATAKYGPIP